MKFPIDAHVFGIFGGKVHPARVRAQSRQYKEFLRMHLYDNVKTIHGHDIRMIVDLHPDDVYDDEMVAQKILFKRKLKGEPESTRYSVEDE